MVYYASLEGNNNMILDNLLYIAVFVFVLMIIGVIWTFKECHYDEQQDKQDKNNNDQNRY